MRRPIEEGWRQITDSAPSPEERANAENWRGIYYAGALHIYQLLMRESPSEQLFEQIEADFDQHLEQARTNLRRQ